MIEARSLTLVHLIAGEGLPSLNMRQLGHHTAKVVDRFSVLLGGKADQPFAKFNIERGLPCACFVADASDQSNFGREGDITQHDI